MTPVSSCTGAMRLVIDITILLGIPKISPVCIARFSVSTRRPPGAVRELSGALAARE
jgi:hypothetical protein